MDTSGVGRGYRHPFAVLVAVVRFVYYTCVVFVFGACYVAAMETRKRG